MSNTGQVKADQLFKGLTRPPMLFGVSFTFVMMNFMTTLIIYIMLKDLRILIIVAPVLHMIGYIICFKEPLFVELMLVRSQKCTRCKNRLYHNANSYDVC